MTNNNTSGQNGRRRVGRTIVLNGLNENRDGNKNNKSSQKDNEDADAKINKKRKKEEEEEKEKAKRLISSFQDSNGMANRL